MHSKEFARVFASVAAIIVACLSSTAARAQTKHVPTLEEALDLKRISSPLISPDGKWIVYTIRETNWKDNEYVRQLWLMDVASGQSLQLTRGKKSADNADWSPDGRWISFVTERESVAITPREAAKDEKEKGEKEKGEKEKKDASATKPATRQIWLISPHGGEAWQLTEHEADIAEYRWSKDGKQLAFVAAEPETKRAKDRKEKYSDFDVIERDFSQNQIWTVDVAAVAVNCRPAKAKQITHNLALHVNSFAWSPDGSRIAFSATPNPLLSFRGDADIYLADLAHDNAVHKIVALDGPDTNPVFSPDGKQIAFSTALAQQHFYYANSHLASVDIDRVLAHPATQPSDVSDLTASFDENPQMIDWAPDGLYFEALHKTNAHLFHLDPKTHAISRITSPDNFLLGDVSFTTDFKTFALTSQDAQNSSEIFITSTANFAPRKLTDMNALIKDWTLGSPEVVSWKSQDGATIEGILYKPADFNPSKKYPLLVVIHGGPTGISLPTLSVADTYYPIQIFLSKGALVLEPNYRGSAGYGGAFRALNARNLGVGDMWDVMAGVDSLIARGIVDPSRLGSMGWSQGGYISAFLTTHTDRFKAISVGAGISDWMTYYVNTDITPFTRQYLDATPWDDPEIYAKTSPISTIKQAKTPTLIQQGSNDKRVPVPDSFELYRGLLDQNVPARLILYNNFGHGITRPKSNHAVLQANLDWFSHYIWGEPIPKDSPLMGSSEAGPEESKDTKEN